MLRYAEQRGITVVPEIDVPGHCYASRVGPDGGETKSSTQCARHRAVLRLDDIFSKQLKQKSENKLDHVKYSGK